MSADARAIGRVFPSTYFQHLSVGTFTKALPLASVTGDLATMAIIGCAIVALARVSLRRQEK